MSSGKINAPYQAFEYSEKAFRSGAIPQQKPLEDPGRFAKALEGGDFLERLPWGSYAGLDIHVRPQYVLSHQKRLSKGAQLQGGRAWTHVQKPKDLIKTRWQLLLMFAGGFADQFMFRFWMFCAFAVFLMGVFKEGVLLALQYGTWPMAAIVALHLFFRYPFIWFLERHPDFIVKDLGCGFFRPTGMVKFRTWREETFEAPFIEFDPYISFHVNPKGPTSCKLQLRHRYTGWQTAVASVHSTLKHELYAHWDELQRYMDVSQPLPDIPALEPYRHLDPTTAEHDAAGNRGRPADYWATLDLEWWEKEGYPAHLYAIREFPWHQLRDRMQDSVPNLNAGAMV